MRIERKDQLATLLVGGGVLAYVLWLLGVGSEDETAVRIVTTIVLVLGFVASANAVVPGFDGLLHGSKTYLVISTLVGLGALAAGIAALVSGDELMLGLLVAATVLLWAMSTIRHSMVAGPAGAGFGGSPAAG